QRLIVVTRSTSIFKRNRERYLNKQERFALCLLSENHLCAAVHSNGLNAVHSGFLGRYGLTCRTMQVLI
ncbi:MAG: hypothetical protein SVW57_09030, partial [Thermodesulfobacteriota bacterium]|nr:hypothetical protein [Thermodesulfobacteriota bacterium]